MTTKTLSKSELAQFTGSDNWYRHTINRNVLYTDGAQHVAEHGGAYWLLDEIAIIQPYNKRVAAEEFQVWKLTVDPTEALRSRATMATTTSCSLRGLNTRIFRWMKSRCTSPTTSSTCRASTEPCTTRVGVLAGAGCFLAVRENTVVFQSPTPGRAVRAGCSGVPPLFHALCEGWLIFAILRVHVIVEEFRRPA